MFFALQAATAAILFTGGNSGRPSAIVWRGPEAPWKPAGSSVLACEVADSTGELTAVFYGRAHVAGLEPVPRSGCAAWSASATTAASR